MSAFVPLKKGTHHLNQRGNHGLELEGQKKTHAFLKEINLELIKKVVHVQNPSTSFFKGVFLQTCFVKGLCSSRSADSQQPVSNLANRLVSQVSSPKFRICMPTSKHKATQASPSPVGL